MKEVFFIVFLLISNVFALEIGYINTDLLLSESSQFKDSQQKIVSEFKQRDDKLKLKAEKIKKLLAIFEDEKEDLTKKEYKERIDNIKILDQELQSAALKLKKQFDFKGKKELQKIQDTINTIIRKFAKNNNIDLIIYKNVAFVSEKVDITRKIAKQLELSYKK